MKTPDFKDALRELIEKDGGVNAQNLERISRALRVSEETFTPQRLNGLLRGLPPTPRERQAISQELEPTSDRWLSENWPLEDVESRGFAKLAFGRMKSHVLAKGFVEYVQEEAVFRNESHLESELVGIHNDFRESRELEDEIELFGLER